MARTYENFDVELLASGPTYEAIFRSIPGEPRLAISFPLEDHELTAFLALFGKQQTRRMESPEFARVRAVGKRLFDTLFTTDIRKGLTDATRAAMQQGHGLRVRLDVSQAGDLGMVPWEYMYFQEYDDFVSLSNWTPVVRYLDVAEPLPPIPLDGPLRVLVMISDPIERRGTLDVEREWSQLEQALAGPASRGEIELHRLPDGQLETLQIDLQRNQYHVFHFIGHGEYSEEHDDGVLAFEDARGREVHVPGNTLGTYLRDSLDTRLVVLNNCEGAAFESDPFTGSAQSLLRKGIPAVVAMQFEITDRAAIDFARGFYMSVGNGFPVDAALAEARKVIRGGPTRIEFGSPVLYMSADDGTLFVRSEEVEIPDDADNTSLTPAVVTGATETDLENRGAAPDEVETAHRQMSAEKVLPGAPETEEEPGEHEEEEPPATVEETKETPPSPLLPPEEETEPPDRRIWALAVAALVVIVGLATLANVLGDDDPGTETTQVSIVEATGSGTDITVPSEATPFVAWTRVPDQPSLGGEGDQGMYDVTRSDAMWVAVGVERRGSTSIPAVWRSSDAQIWDRVSDDALAGPQGSFSRMLAVVPWESGFLALGTAPEAESGTDQDAAVWRSQDGETWTRDSAGSEALGGSNDQRIRNVTAWTSGLVAVGFEDVEGDQNGAIWLSSNGVDWERVADPNGIFGGEGTQRIHAVVPAGRGLVAVGESGPGDDLDFAVWVSADGEVWERIQDGDGVRSGPGHQVAYSVASKGDGMLVAGGFVGSGDNFDGALWTSHDGVTWSQGDGAGLTGPRHQVVHTVTQLGPGWVAAGWTFDEEGQNGAIWASEDGLSWVSEDAEAAGLTGPNAERIESIAASGFEVVAVGIAEGESPGAVAWHGIPSD